MINIQVAKLDARRIEKMQRAFSDFQSGAFLRGIHTADLAASVLEHLQEISGSRSGRRDIIHHYAKDRTRARLLAVADGWRIQRSTANTRVMFTITNLLMTAAGEAGRKRMMAIEYGSRASIWVAKRGFKYVGDYGWVTVAEGQQMRHAATPPKNYTGQAADYIKRVMMPEIRRRVTESFRRRMA